MSTEQPTVDDIARALANQISEDIPVRDVTASFSVRAASAAAHGHRSSGAPLARIAERVHAELYGLPLEPKSAPETLRELADASSEALAQDEQRAVFEAAIAQLPDLAALLDRAALWAERHPAIPDATARQITAAAALTRQMTTDLAQASRAFEPPTTMPTRPAARPLPPPAGGRARR